MRKTGFPVTGLLFFFALAGCTAVKRFKTVEYKGEDRELVHVELFSTSLSGYPAAAQQRNLWTLSANAQTRMVQILDERFPDNEQFMGMISGTFGSRDNPEEGLVRKDLRMVFTINKRRDYPALNEAGGRFSPADRIEYLRISMEIPQSYGLRFYEWNRYSTEYGEIEIADISFSRNLDLSLDGVPGSLEAGSQARLGRSEKQVLSKRYLKMNGSINERQMVIEEEGTREVDLTGNVIAEVSLVFDGFPEIVMIPLFLADSAGALILAGLNFEDVLVPALREVPDTIFADLGLEYVYRHVASGWKTFAEWDDKVEYYQGSKSRKVPLFLKKDIVPGFYCIGTDQGERYVLKLRKNQGKEYLLQFPAYHQASRFLEWLENPSVLQPGVPMGNYRLRYAGEPITPGEVSEKGLKVLPVY